MQKRYVMDVIVVHMLFRVCDVIHVGINGSYLLWSLHCSTDADSPTAWFLTI